MDLTNTDIYKFKKEEVIPILKEFKVEGTETNTQEELRKILSLIKRIQVEVKANTEYQRAYDYLIDFNSLTPQQRKDYPELEQLEILRNPKKYKQTTNLTQELVQNKNIASVATTHLYDIVTFEKLYENVEKTEGNIYEVVTNPLTNKNTNTDTQMETKEKIPLVQPTQYHGLPSEDIHTFISRYEVASRANGWTPKTQINLLPTYLAQSALNWYENFIQKNQRGEITWEKAKQELIKLFAPVGQCQNLQLMLENKIQHETEPSISFYLQIQALCRRMNPNIEDKQIISHVIQGLRPEICECIISMENNTLNQLEENLRKIEQQLFQKTLNKQRYLRNFESATTKSTKQFETLNTMSEKLEQLTEIVHTLGININQNPPSLNKREQSITPQYKTHKQISNTHQKPLTQFRPGYHINNGQRSARQFCTICKKNNHSTNRCFFRKYNCNICRMDNHTTEQCSFNQKEKTYPEYTKNQNRPYTDKMNQKFCSKCKRNGHTTQECYTNNNSTSKYNQKNGLSGGL